MAVVSSKRALIIAFSVCLAGSAAAQSALSAAAQSNQAWGTPLAIAGPAIAPASVAVGRVNASLRYTNASFGTGAVGLRNRADGSIEVSGVSGAIKRARIYWAVITSGPPTATASNIYLKKGGAGASFTNIAGTAIGTGASPCWRGDRVTVFRGDIPLSIATGNGLYVVRLRPGANGNTNGLSPWVLSNPPLVEGASLVIVGTGTATVAIYDSGLAGKMFYDLLSYQLYTPVSVASASEVLFHNIGADGQIGVGVRASTGTASEITTLNGRRIAGPLSPVNDSDWNGGIAGPLPQLWDNTTHDVTTAARAGSSSTVLPFTVRAPDDCLVTIANVLSIR